MRACLMALGILTVSHAVGQTNTMKLTNATIARVDGIIAAFDYPADWKLERKQTETGNPNPRVGVHPDNLIPEVIMSFHGKWDDGTKAEYLEFIDGSLQDLFKERIGQLENQQIAIKSIDGEQVYGRYVVFTYKTPPEKLKPADNFKHMLAAKLISNNHYIFASIAHNSVDGPSFQQALNVLKSIRVKPKGS